MAEGELDTAISISNSPHSEDEGERAQIEWEKYHPWGARRPLPTAGRWSDERPLWEPPCLNYSHLIDNEIFLKQRGAILKYTNNDIPRTTAIIDAGIESVLTYQYLDWAEDNCEFSTDEETRKFFGGLANEIFLDKEESLAECQKLNVSVVQDEDGNWFAMALDERQRANWRCLLGTKHEYSNPVFEALELAELNARRSDINSGLTSQPGHIKSGPSSHVDLTSLYSFSLSRRLICPIQNSDGEGTPLALRMLSLHNDGSQDENNSEELSIEDDVD